MKHLEDSYFPSRFGPPEPNPPPTAAFRHVFWRQLGVLGPPLQHAVGEYVSRRLPGMLKESQFDMGTINKVFAARWISDKQVVFGTKCNKLQILDIKTRKMVHIPSLRSSVESIAAQCPCGIHSITINPSRTLLATGGDSTNDLAIYKLPTFDPVCVGEKGHTDWIFDISWLDDEFVVTGSRDSNICLWQIGENVVNSVRARPEVVTHPVIVPKSLLVCNKAEKVRALAFNSNCGELAALSLNAQIHLFDLRTFRRSNVTFLDTRTMKNAQYVDSMQRGSGIRSVSFNENVLTIGTGAGCVYFYDVRNQKYLELSCGHTCALQVGKGWLRHDETYRDYFMHSDYPNAIYTHCYDDSGTKLFAAGGPLPAGLWGNYAGIWH